MDIVLANDEVVLKTFNNNIVLINVDNTEKILFGKGIGFGKKTGEVIKKGTVVNKIFAIEQEKNRKNLFELIKQTDEKFFGICEEAICEVANEIEDEFNESIHISLIDHLYLAIKRIKNEEKVDNPFLVQIQTLHGEEFNIAEKICKIVGEKLNVIIPESEVGFVALHIYSAIANKSLSSTMKSNYLGKKIVERIEDEIGYSIDRKSLEYARFLTHIKFAIQRISDNEKSINELNDVIKVSFKESYRIAKEASKIIEKELDVKVDEEEITFLAIHIERLKK